MEEEVEQALAMAFQGWPAGSWDEQSIRDFIPQLLARGCSNLPEKIREYNRSPHRAGDLRAELALALTVSRWLGCAIEFGVGATADTRFSVDGVDCLMEVVHKSAPDAFSKVFHPEPLLLPQYANGRDWQRDAFAFHEVLARLPVAVQPWLSRDLAAPRTTGRDRTKHERVCGVVARWLADRLEDAVQNRVTSLDYDGTTRFELEFLSEGPGYMKGSACLEAWICTDDAQRQSVAQKISIARERLAASGADCYFVGVAVDSAFVARGHDLLHTLLNGSVYDGDENRSFRPVSAARIPQVEEAQRRGRDDILALAGYDPSRNNLHGQKEGLFFEPESADVGGVIATYYTGTLQFVPNPFTTNDIDVVRTRFPPQLTPFEVPA